MISWTGSNKEIKKVGLVGCGRMGKCMLESMRNGGFAVVAYDKFPAAAASAGEMGAEIVASPKELAQRADVIVMSLPGPVQLEEVLFGEDGLKKGLTSDHVVIDTSTVDPQTTRNNSSRVEETGAAYLDCPILGRPSATGKWMLPTGGNPDALEKVKPVLLTFAANAISVGPSGAGNALKLLNQLMFSCINGISSEVMAICDHVGIDKKVFYDTVASSSAATVSGLFREVGKSIVNDGFETPAFTVDLLIKDAKLGLQMAKDADAPCVIAGNVQLYNEIAHAEGLGTQDTSALYKVFSQHYEKLS
jgi:3-hydroxyisobutyrate dehydrogenase-like beta-hydroxyacid dehydrogenase